MQNTLQQLDLFGMPAPAISKKKEKPVKLVAVKEEPLNEPGTPEAVNTHPQPEPVMVAISDEAAEKKAAATIASARKTVSSPKEKRTPGKRGRKSFKEMDSEADLIEVPDEETLQKKLYYSISEVAGWFKVNTSLLRYWENEFDILQPRKTRKGDRLFRMEDIKNLQLIYFLLRQRKFSIDGAKNYLKNNRREADTQARLTESLTKFKSFLLELKANLQS